MPKHQPKKEVITLFEVYKEEQNYMFNLFLSLSGQVNPLDKKKKIKIDADELKEFLSKLQLKGFQHHQETMQLIESLKFDFINRFKKEKGYYFSIPIAADSVFPARNALFDNLIHFAIAWAFTRENINPFADKIEKKEAIRVLYKCIGYYYNGQPFKERLGYYKQTVLATYFAYKMGCFYENEITEETPCSILYSKGKYHTKQF